MTSYFDILIKNPGSCNFEEYAPTIYPTFAKACKALDDTIKSKVLDALTRSCDVSVKNKGLGFVVKINATKTEYKIIEKKYK